MLTRRERGNMSYRAFYMTNPVKSASPGVTEISYNYVDDLYRAEIEFIMQQDWEKELNILFQDPLDSQGKISHDATNADTEAGVAYAKIRAVYPNYTREKLEECSVDDLINHENVQDVLGITKEVTASDSLLFYKQVQSIVDSKEKTTGDKNKDKAAAKKVEYWPGRDKRKMIITHEQSDSSKRKRGHNALSPRKKSRHADSNIEGSSADYGGDQTEGGNELEAIEDESGREDH
jgi:hypothetical protein